MSLLPLTAYPSDVLDAEKALHFDLTQIELKSLNFKHDDEFKPVLDDFKIKQATVVENGRDFGHPGSVAALLNAGIVRSSVRMDIHIFIIGDILTLPG